MSAPIAMKNSAVALSLLLSCLASALIAGPVQLRFIPPDLASQNICSEGRTLETVLSDWSGANRWPEHLSSATIRRDITTLRKADGVGHFPLILHMINGLSARDAAFSGKRALLAEIEARLAAGQVDVVHKAHLVPQLADLSTGTSAQIARALSRFYSDGVGVTRDLSVADHHLVTAAKLSHPDALMELAARQIAGDAPADWSEAAALSVQKAFEARLGALDAGICERVKRIARAYQQGDVVAQDAALAQDWLMFAAKLGDALAAWQVYELQVLAEEVTADPKIRINHLKQAAEAGLPFAQIALGQVYERGAIVPQDLDQSLTLYQAAARNRGRPGLVRLALFLEEHPELEAEKIATLEQLSAREDAPGWVFTRLGKFHEERKGRWSNVPQLKAFYEQAVAVSDRDGMLRLARVLLADRKETENFLKATDLLRELVTTHGSTGAAKGLYEAYLCKGPNSPHLREAMYWQDQYLAADPPMPKQEGLHLAALQSQALYGRASALGVWFNYLKDKEKEDQELFWYAYSDGYPVLHASAKDVAELSHLSLEVQQSAVAVLKQLFEAGETAKILRLTELLQSHQPEGFSPELQGLLEEVSQNGSGAALALLRALSDQPERLLIPRALPAIQARGDFEALLLGLPYSDADSQSRMLDQAISVMPCDYKSAMRVVKTASRVGDTARVAQFLTIAAHLHKGKSWAMADLAEALLRYQGVSQAKAAANLYERAFLAGEDTAGERLATLLEDARNGAYNPEKALEIREALSQLKVLAP